MSIFKQAAKEKLRFSTRQGMLSAEQLYELKLTPLANIVRSLKKELKKDNDDDLSFLDEGSTPVDATLQLKFEIAKAIYLDKKEERDAAKNAAEKKAHNEKIMELIAKKQDEDLGSKSVDELKAMLQD